MPKVFVNLPYHLAFNAPHLVNNFPAASTANIFLEFMISTTSLENEIDKLVYVLYNLTEDEIAIVKGAGMDT